MKLDRRQFIQISGKTLAAFAVSSSLLGCVSGSQKPDYQVTFNHGVASGDPLADRVIIWTRLSPDFASDKTDTNISHTNNSYTNNSHTDTVDVMWQAATDPYFENVIRQGSLTTSAAQDFTVKVDLIDLQPATHYFYRFVSAGTVSPTGKTKTLPVGSLSSLKLAFFSCSNYPAGYFNPYADAAKRDDLDVVLHLGDYIYEYSSTGYGTDKADAIGRMLPQDNLDELITLSDYRKRYAVYRTDRGSQSLHAALPMIAVWDDHEVANDTWRDGAQNHNEGEGPFSERKQAALQAYFEWMPIRPVTGEKNTDDHELIYRSFDFGDLVSLHMLDTRICGRDQRYLLKQFSNGQNIDIAAVEQAVAKPDRQLLGSEQYGWLLEQIKQSSARWQILGQQILMARMYVPAVLLSGMFSQQVSPETMGRIVKNTRRMKAGDPSLSAQEKAEVMIKLPYNLDAWDGYAAQRDALLQQIGDMNKSLLVLAGDTHNGWASLIKNKDQQVTGVELATPSVSSPGMEKYLKLDLETVKQFEQVLPEVIDDLQYCDLTQRGYSVLHITPDAISAQWVFVDTVLSEDYQIAETKTFTFNPGETEKGWQPKG